MTEVTSSTLDLVKDTVVEHTGTDRDKLKPETNFARDLGCDSLDMVELSMAFEDDHNIVISDEETMAVTTIAEAADLLDRKLAGR